MGKTKDVIAVYTKTWQSGGAGLFAQELVQGMLDADTGIEVVFVAPPAENPLFEEPRDRLVRIRSHCEVGSSRGRLGRLFNSIRRVTSSGWGLVKARRRAKTVVVTVPDPLVFAIPFLAMLRLSGAKIIYVVHDPLPHAWKLPEKVRWLENSGFSAAYRLSNALVVLSASAREVLTTAYAVGARPVAVIEHGTFVLGAPSPAPGAGALLLFGTLRRNKGILESIEGVLAARAQGAKVRLHIAGSPDPVEPDYWATCEAAARAHPEAVELELGYVTDDRLQLLIGACDAFLLPYREFHSQSGVAMLAASNARAVIASRAGGIGDLIAEGMAGVAIEEPVDSAAVTRAIIAFAAKSVVAWQEQADRFRAETIESRSWQVIGGQYVALARTWDRR